MSELGDVVWADGRTWQRDDDHASGPKEWWIAPKSNPSALRMLKTYNDFRWLVKDGKRIGEDADDAFEQLMDMYRASLAARKQLAGERDRAAQAEREAIVAWLRRKACFTWLLNNTNGFTRDQASNLAVAVERGEHVGGNDEQDALRRCERCTDRLYPSDKRFCVACVEQMDALYAERAAFSRGHVAGRKFERAMIDKWLRQSVPTSLPVAGLAAELIAASIERGEHLDANDE